MGRAPLILPSVYFLVCILFYVFIYGKRLGRSQSLYFPYFIKVSRFFSLSDVLFYQNVGCFSLCIFYPSIDSLECSVFQLFCAFAYVLPRVFSSVFASVSVPMDFTFAMKEIIAVWRELEDSEISLQDSQCVKHTCLFTSSFAPTLCGTRKIYHSPRSLIKAGGQFSSRFSTFKIYFSGMIYCRYELPYSARICEKTFYDCFSHACRCSMLVGAIIYALS